MAFIKRFGRQVTANDEISEEGRQARFAKWEKLGVDRVKHDLLKGGHRLLGGPPQVRELAWEWVRREEAKQAKVPEETPAEVLTLKPNFHGVGVDLKEAGRRIRRRFKKS